MTRTQKFYHSHLKTKENYNIEITFEFDKDADYSDLSAGDKVRYQREAEKALSEHPDYSKVDSIEVWFMEF